MTAHRRRSSPAPLVLASLALLLLLAPLLALVVRTPWRRAGEVLADPAVTGALGLSLTTATVTAVWCLVLGLPLAWVLARTRLPGRALLRAFILVPLVLPPVVAGVALLAAFGRAGLIGEPVAAVSGFSLPFTTAGVVLTHVFVALPFFVLSAEGALRSIDPGLERMAAALGAGRWTTLRRVTLPMAMPGIAAGMTLSWARSLGEFGATITFAGNYPGSTRTLPLLVYIDLQADPARALAVSVMMMAVAILVIVSLRGRWLSAFR